MNFPDIGRAKRSLTLAAAARFSEAETNSKVGAGAKKRSHPRTSLAERWELRRGVLSPATASYPTLPDPAVLSSPGARVLARLPLILGDPTPVTERGRVQRDQKRARRVPGTLLLGVGLPALLPGLCSASTCWMWRW